MIFLILVLFWLSETGQILGFQAFSEKPMEEMAWNFACWCILTTFRTDKIMVTVCWFFLILMLFWNLGFPGILVMLCGFSSLWWPFGWNWSYLGFLGIIWRTCGSKCRGEGGGIFLTLCVECCLVFNLFPQRSFFCILLSCGHHILSRGRHRLSSGRHLLSGGQQLLFSNRQLLSGGRNWI